MKIEELFRQLSFGELSNLSLSADGSGTIKPEKHEAIILHVQTILDKLYGKFLLLEKSLFLTPLGTMSRYPLMARYSIYGRNPDETADPFIIDTPEEPFTEDVVKVLSAVDQENRPVLLNDETADFSLFTPSPEVIQFPRVNRSNRTILSLILNYQARHPRLDPIDVEQEFMLPTVLEHALRQGVAWQVYSHLNGEGNTAKGMEFQSGYETACAEVIDRDLVSQTGATLNNKFHRNGFR